MKCDTVSRNPAAREGVVYVEPYHLQVKLQEYEHAGQAWVYNNIVSSYQPNRRVLYKSIKKLSPHSEDDFQQIIAECRAQQLDAPSSFADMFHQVYRSPLCQKSSVSGFYGINFGGWQEALWVGRVQQPIWHYDLNQAYRWAACIPLPDVAQASPTTSFHDELACYLVEIQDGEIPYTREPGLKMITSEERDRWKLKTRPVLFGVKFHRSVSLEETFREVEQRFPYCYKRMGRSFWGRWNTVQMVNQCSWKSGYTVRPLKNFLYNPFWPAFITSRVKMRMAKEMGHAVHVFVDSVLSLQELETSPAVGGFKLVDRYDDLSIYGPGQWGRKGYLIKHAGLPC